MKHLLLILFALTVGCALPRSQTIDLQQESFEAAQELVHLRKVEQHVLFELRYLMQQYHHKTGKALWINTVVLERRDGDTYYGSFWLRTAPREKPVKFGFNCNVDDTFSGATQFVFDNHELLNKLSKEAPTRKPEAPTPDTELL